MPKNVRIGGNGARKTWLGAASFLFELTTYYNYFIFRFYVYIDAFFILTYSSKTLDTFVRVPFMYVHIRVLPCNSYRILNRSTRPPSFLCFTGRGNDDKHWPALFSFRPCWSSIWSKASSSKRTELDVVAENHCSYIHYHRSMITTFQIHLNPNFSGTHLPPFTLR